MLLPVQAILSNTSGYDSISFSHDCFFVKTLTFAKLQQLCTNCSMVYTPGAHDVDKASRFSLFQAAFGHYIRFVFGISWLEKAKAKTRNPSTLSHSNACLRQFCFFQAFCSSCKFFSNFGSLLLLQAFCEVLFWLWLPPFWVFRKQANLFYLFELWCHLPTQQ